MTVTEYYQYFVAPMKIHWPREKNGWDCSDIVYYNFHKLFLNDLAKDRYS